MAKYVLDSSETSYQEGSNELVLQNKLAIIDEQTINAVEMELLNKLYEHIFADTPSNLPNTTFDLILNWHKKWLGNVYEWAGQVRQVQMSKPGIIFAATNFIEQNIDAFERQYLTRFEQIPKMGDEEFISFAAQCHVEFILIHPFREGNGRMSRLLMDYQCTKFGIGSLDYSLWNEHKDFYFKSIQAGIAGDYQHIERLVRDIVK